MTTQESRIPQYSEQVSDIATSILLISLVMLFATLLMAYAAYRVSSPQWPPIGSIRPSLVIPTISTLIILASSLSYICHQRKRQLRPTRWLYLTIVLGVVFLAFQYVLWKTLPAQGLWISSGIFASLIYALSWIHALHLIIGLGVLCYLAFMWQRLRPIHIANVGRFWHFLGITWAIVYLTIFVV